MKPVLMEKEQMTPGYRANLSGKEHETTVESVLSVFAKKIEKDELKFSSKSVFITHPSFVNVYDNNAKADFGVILNDLKIRLECKNQEVNGSVVEKLSFVMDNFEHTSLMNFKEEVAILVLDGQFYQSNTGINAYKFCQKRAEQIMQRSHKEIYVVNGLRELENLMLSLHEKSLK